MVDLGELKKAELSDLVKILGSSVAVDVKRQLSKQIKEAKKKIKEEKSLVQGAAEYLAIYKSCMAYCNRKIKEIQMVFLAQEKLVFYLFQYNFNFLI